MPAFPVVLEDHVDLIVFCFFAYCIRCLEDVVFHGFIFYRQH